MLSCSEVARAMTFLYGGWNRPVNEGTAQAYLLVLNEFDRDELSEGVMAAMKAGGPHPPCAGDLRQFVLGERERRRDRLARVEAENRPRVRSAEPRPAFDVMAEYRKLLSENERPETA